MRQLSPWNKTWVCTACLALGVSLTVLAAPKKRIVINKPNINPAAETVELFDGIDKGVINARLVPRNADGGNVFIENNTDRPLTIKLPKAVAAVQVLKQGFGGGGGGGLGNNNNANGNNSGAQAMGGGMGMGMMGGGMGMGGGMMGGGMFSVGPEQVAQLPMKSVCLEHGKPDPRPSMTYKLIPVSQHSSDPNLNAMLEQFVAGNVDQKSAQAAAWHIANNMSWEQLANKKIKHLGGVPAEPYFQSSQLMQAQNLVANAQRAVRERKLQDPTTTPTTTAPLLRKE